MDLIQVVKTPSSTLQGESAAVLSTIDALATCLEKPGGCAVVPGLPTDQYNLTLGTSILGGLVAGYASRLQPDGDRPYIWLFFSCHHTCLAYSYHDIQLRYALINHALNVRSLSAHTDTLCRLPLL